MLYVRESQILIYPNPAINRLYLEGSELDNIPIYNMPGQNVTEPTKQFANHEDKVVIDLTQLNNGLYFVKVKKISKRCIYVFDG